MSRQKKKAIIDDGCDSRLVRDALFQLPLGIPVIKAPAEIVVPKSIVPFSQRNVIDPCDCAVGFYEMDISFSAVLRNPELYVSDFARFGAVISPDCSLYRDAPLAVQLANIYRNRAIGAYFQSKGLYVIPQIRWGNEYTYTTQYFPEKVAFLGVEKGNMVAIGTYGCSKSREDRYHLSAGLDEMIETIEPSVVLVYGPMAKEVFAPHINSTRFIQYDDWTTRQHKLYLERNTTVV